MSVEIRRQLVRVVVFFYHMAPKDVTQVTRHGGMGLYLLS